MALGAQHRLKSEAEFKELFKNGKAVKNSFFFIKYLKYSGPTKVAIIISSKTSPKAVTRNRLKRKVSQWVSTNVPMADPGFMIAITILADSVTAEQDILSDKLKELFQKTSII